MDVQELPVARFEKVVRGHDPAADLTAFIAVHDTTLGPALGGIRCWEYASESEALTDVQRLAEGMTYKSAVAETGLGGGKSVVVLRKGQKKTPELLRAMGRFIDSLGGLYVGAEDVGTSEADMVAIRGVTRFVAGLPRESGGSGNPSPYTAIGVFEGVLAALEHVFHSADLHGRTVAITGCGSVGSALARQLAAAGARLILADVREGVVAQLAKELGAAVESPDRIHTAACDVFAPCALGGGLNDVTIPEIRARIIAGAANNQLAEPRHGDELRRRGITYAPDFVINAGGILAVSFEVHSDRFDEARALERVRDIRRVVANVLRAADRQQISTGEAAVLLAKERLARGRR